MTNFEIYDTHNAPEKSKPFLVEVQNKFGFIPNLIGTLAESDVATKAYLSVANIFGESSLSAIEQQAILIAVSVENSCEYCVAAHSVMAKNFAKADNDIVTALRNGGILPDAKLNALIEFSREVVRERGFISAKKLDSLFQSGYSKKNALEVIVGVTQKTLSNYTNHLAKIDLDEQFSSEKWQAS